MLGTRASSATGMKALSTSYGCFFIAYGLTASTPTWPRMIVWPSGAELATSLIAIVPAPPGLFSTNTDWPSCLLSSCATLRDTTSELPPGANGTTKRIGLVGQLCAAAARGRRIKARTRARRSMRVSW